MILFRPVGLEELLRIDASGMRAFPPRLPGQPIFYPVLNEAYARQIARDWNTRSGSRAGFVTRFEVDDAYASRFERRVVGGRVHEELWVQAEELEEFNRHILGAVDVVAAYFGEDWADPAGDIAATAVLLDRLAAAADRNGRMELARSLRVAAREVPMKQPRRSRLEDRVVGGIIGLLVGDALGVPYEFHAAADIPPVDEIEYAPPAGFDRAHKSVAPGTWSDDGAQALCLLASLLDRSRLDVDDFARRLMRWYDDGYMAVDGVVFDVGVTTGRAIRALRAGAAPLEAGPADVHDNGNGSLMRVLPLALWHRGPDGELVRDAHLQSRVTHGHLRSQVCCALHCLWARRILAGDTAPWQSAAATLRTLYATEPDALRELEWSIRPDDPPQGRGSGYVVDSLRSARLVLAAGRYEDVVRAAVSLGDDTDTTAAVAGGIAGLRDGIDAIPQRWRAGLRGREIYQSLLEELLRWMREHPQSE